MKSWRTTTCILGMMWTVWSVVATAQDPESSTFQSFAGAFLASHTHDYFVESELWHPVLQLDPVSAYFHYRESTPFVRNKDGPQAEVLYRRQEAEVDFNLNDSLRLITIGGFEQTDQVDEPGLSSAYAIGGGIGSRHHDNDDRVNWSVLAGGYLSQKNLSDNWWLDGHLAWRVVEFGEQKYLESAFRPSLALAANAETVNDNSSIHPFVKIGPGLQLMTGNGNRAQVLLLWYYNDHNPFYGSHESGLLFGLEVSSAFETNYVFNARAERQSGWLPLVWGEYDVGAGETRRISLFDMNVELFDLRLHDHLFTGVVSYQSRQEYRLGDYDNIAYSVSLGMQTPIGLESIASHDEPLVFGAGFLHRSDHALAPFADRVPPEGIDNDSHNVLPNICLKTTGWDLPYRNPDIYCRDTRWLNLFDWRILVGYDVSDDRDRGKFAGQIGLNWDIATIQGFVVYATGLGSVGNETPDWLAEAGVRRRGGKVFVRYDNYGMKSDIARGDTLVAGFGVFL